MAAVSRIKWHVVVWIAVILFYMLTGVGKVEASSAPQIEKQEVHAAGCHAWRQAYGKITWGKDQALPMSLRIDFSWYYNGCSTRPAYASCSWSSFLVSIKKEWCGFWGPTGLPWMDVGMDYTVSALFNGFPIQWFDYERVRLYNNGTRSGQWPHPF